MNFNEVLIIFVVIVCVGYFIREYVHNRIVDKLCNKILDMKTKQVNFKIDYMEKICDNEKQIELLKLYTKELLDDFVISPYDRRCIKDRCMKRARAKIKKMEEEK